MSIEQEIWDDFKELSEPNIYERISYGKAKAHFGIKYENVISKVDYIGGHQQVFGDVDYKIEKILNSGAPINWDEVLKLYPVSNRAALYKEKMYPKARFRSHYERNEISNILKTWSSEHIKYLFPNKNKAINYLEHVRWGNTPACPRCECEKLYDIKNNGRNGFKCSDCYYKFSALVGTIFENTKIPLTKWYESIHLLTSIQTQKISTIQLSNVLNVTQNTAWYMVKRIQSKASDEFISKIKTHISAGFCVEDK